jgi:hypothetical protein
MISLREGFGIDVDDTNLHESRLMFDADSLNDLVDAYFGAVKPVDFKKALSLLRDVPRMANAQERIDLIYQDPDKALIGYGSATHEALREFFDEGLFGAERKAALIQSAVSKIGEKTDNAVKKVIPFFDSQIKNESKKMIIKDFDFFREKKGGINIDFVSRLSGKLADCPEDLKANNTMSFVTWSGHVDKLLLVLVYFNDFSQKFSDKYAQISKDSAQIYIDLLRDAAKRTEFINAMNKFYESLELFRDTADALDVLEEEICYHTMRIDRLKLKKK